MTEAEAKTKPCIGPNPMNTGWLTPPNEQGVSVFVCRGSACMAWREYETPENRQRAEAEFRKTGARLRLMDGYCGLAGKP